MKTRPALLLVSVALLSFTQVPDRALARDNDSNKQMAEMLTTELRQKITEYICQDGGAWMKCFSLEPRDCPKISKQFINPCVDRVVPTLVEQSDQETQARASIELALCFNKIFLGRYGGFKVESEECREPPEHLK